MSDGAFWAFFYGLNIMWWMFFVDKHVPFRPRWIYLVWPYLLLSLAVELLMLEVKRLSVAAIRQWFINTWRWWTEK